MFNPNEKELKELFKKYNFKYSLFKEKPEVILLALSLFTFLEDFRPNWEQTIESVLTLLQNTHFGTNMNTVDELFDETNRKDEKCFCVQCYFIFKQADKKAERDAVVSLYEWYVCGRYLTDT